MRYNLKSALVGVTAVAAVFAILVVAYDTLHDDRVFTRINQGMSEAEVLSIAGKPDRVQGNGDWYYTLFSPGGPVAVMFDENRTVEAIDWTPSYD